MEYDNLTSLILEKIGIFKPIKLPYSFNSLEPFIDEETMKLHYNKHYKGYITKLNSLITGNQIPLRDLVLKSANKKEDIRNNAGGAYNHELFWNMLTPNKAHIKGPLKELIEKKFKTIDNFYGEFTEEAINHFGSGWVWLTQKGGALSIKHTTNQDNPLMHDLGVPILGIDIWEHAYYKQYGPDRARYVRNFLKIVNWDYCNFQLEL